MPKMTKKGQKAPFRQFCDRIISRLVKINQQCHKILYGCCLGPDLAKNDRFLTPIWPFLTLFSSFLAITFEPGVGSGFYLHVRIALKILRKMSTWSTL